MLAREEQGAGAGTHVSSQPYFGSGCCVRTRSTALEGFAKDPQPAQHPLHALSSIPLPTHPQPQHPTRTVSLPQGIRRVPSLRRWGAGSRRAAELEPFAQPFSHSEPASCVKAELNWKNTHNDLLWNVV